VEVWAANPASADEDEADEDEAEVH